MKNGLYTLQVVVKNGDQTVKQFTHKLAIMPDYSPQFMEGYSRIVMGMHYPQGKSNPKDTELLKRVGIKIIRDELYWNTIEKAKGSYDFSFTDSYMNPLRDEQIEPRIILDFSNTLYSGEGS